MSDGPKPDKCEATAMDFAWFGETKDPVPPCDEAPAAEVDGYWLCAGCHDALDRLKGVAWVIKRERGT